MTWYVAIPFHVLSGTPSSCRVESHDGNAPLQAHQRHANVLKKKSLRPILDNQHFPNR
jgi:hypothetical protein